MFAEDLRKTAADGEPPATHSTTGPPRLSQRHQRTPHWPKERSLTSAQLTRDQPTRTQPTRDQPTRTQPTRVQSTGGQPSRMPPSRHQAGNSSRPQGLSSGAAYAEAQPTAVQTVPNPVMQRTYAQVVDNNSNIGEVKQLLQLIFRILG